MGNNIKSFDLCSKCKFDYVVHCCGADCLECENMIGIDCKCNTVPQNTPCPFYTPAENE